LDINEEKARLLLQTYLIYGGYPAVVTSSTNAEKHAILSEIISSYIQRDIREILSINHVSAFAKLINVLSHQASYPIKYTSLAQYINVSSNTVKEYIWYLQHTYILRESKPYFTNPLKEIVKEPCTYFVDLGLLNFHRNNLYPDFNTPSFGLVFQNFIFNELYHYIEGQNMDIKYWRTKDAAEVDIVLDVSGIPIPMEIKYTDTKKEIKSRSLQSFIKRYKPKVAYIISMSHRFSYYIENTNIIGINYLDLKKTIVNLEERLFG
jgi:predicted AAA+ superfamily ATPase